MDPEHNKTVVREFDALASGRGDLSRVEALCTPDIVNHALASGRPVGIEGTRTFLESARRDRYPARWLSSRVVAEGEFVVQFGSREQEWAGGPFRGSSSQRAAACGT